MIVASMFDESGNMVRPWAAAGHTCFCFDWLNGYEIEEFAGGGTINYIPADLSKKSGIRRVIETGADFVFGFPPCTDLAISGARHFAAKEARDPQVFDKAMALVMTVVEVGEALGVPWFLENPISKITSIWRKPDFRFQPWEYGGYLPEDDVHPRWPDYIAPRDAYPKTTCLWVGGGYTIPPKKPVPTVAENVRYSTQYRKLGGKSEKTKQIRSETPRGFALANFLHLTGDTWY